MRQSFSTSFFLFCTAALVVSESDNTSSLRRRQLGDEGAPQIPSKQPRIIGGDDADNDRYPYFALMNGRALCGAVLIGPRFVLTAAHCVGSDNDFQIGIAELSMWDSLVGSTKEYSYKQRLIHPDYDDNDILNDIAIYELNESLPSSIPYIKLKRDPLVASGTPLTVIGFGDTAASGVIENPSDSLLEATVDYVSQSSCRSQMGSSTITDDMLCAFGNGRDSCGGDSGGPLIMKGATPGSDELVGLVSWGVECAHPLYPGVYTRISYFYDWIVDSMCAMNPDGAPDGITCETGSVVDEVTAPPTSDTSTYSWGNADDDFYFYEQTDDDFFGGFWDEATAWFEDLFGF